MPNFAYTARDAAGLSVTGTMIAATIGDVGKSLRAKGQLPVNVQPTADKSAAGTAGIKVSRTDVIQLSTQLAIMVDTGVTLTDALDCIAATATKPKLKLMLQDLSTQVQGGIDFSVALGRHPKSFPTLFIALIAASEKSGMLPKMLDRATNYLREEADIVRKVKGAITYPGIMFAFAVTTTIFLLIFVLPQFTKIYASKAAALPTPTKILMGLSDGLIHHWMLIVPAVLGTVGGLWWVVNHTVGGRQAFHTLQIKAPLIGPMFRQLHLSRGLRMIGTMGGSGVHLMDCVQTAKNLCDNYHFKNLWTEVEQRLQVGKQLSDTLFTSPLVPRPIAQMIGSAEKSGKLAHVMEQLAGYSETELKEKIAELTRYIEPVMIVAMGGIIGGVALALLLPIFTISKVMSQ